MIYYAIILSDSGTIDDFFQLAGLDIPNVNLMAIASDQFIWCLSVAGLLILPLDRNKGVIIRGITLGHFLAPRLQSRVESGDCLIGLTAILFLGLALLLNSTSTSLNSGILRYLQRICLSIYSLF